MAKIYFSTKSEHTNFFKYLEVICSVYTKNLRDITVIEWVEKRTYGISPNPKYSVLFSIYNSIAKKKKYTHIHTSSSQT